VETAEGAAERIAGGRLGEEGGWVFEWPSLYSVMRLVELWSQTTVEGKVNTTSKLVA
jgi:hypothetical protein